MSSWHPAGWGTGDYHGMGGAPGGWDVATDSALSAVASAAAAGPTGAPASCGIDPCLLQSLQSHACLKTQLNSYCQRLLRRPLSPEDIVYTEFQCGTLQQVVVDLTFMDDTSVAGELSETTREAVQSAAGMALEYLKDLHGPLPKKKKCRPGKAERSRYAEDPAAASEGDAEREELARRSSATPQASLNTLCMRAAGPRHLVRRGVVYSVVWSGDGWQATVRATTLPWPWQHMLWTGKVCKSKRDAKQASAEEALASLSQNPSFMDLMEQDSHLASTPWQ